MKRIVLSVLFGLLLGNLSAQEPDAAAKNAGNAAWKAKNYQEAFVNFEKYLESVKFSDNAYVYNAAVAASKIDNFSKAEKYFDMSIKNNYKLPSAYLGKANAQEDLKKPDMMLQTLETGLKALPGNSKLENKYSTYYLKAGVEAQKKNNLTKAIESYNKVVGLQSKEAKLKAYTALASLYFNNGASILQKATPKANTDKEFYEAEKTKAQAEFKKALENVNQASVIDPANGDVKTLTADIQKAMK
ncbi:MAG: hypothetical protein LBM07_03920 [Culturomica sp.]|jgi:pilus assembly protein Flp/PilA|nr:hypothetical protein [Culturomica sp.]